MIDMFRIFFFINVHPPQDLLPWPRDATNVDDRESGADCPNAILVLRLHT